MWTWLRFLLPAVLLVTATLQADSGHPDVLLITIDTLRADHVGCYGHLRAQTPNIDRLSREGVLFSDAVSQVPLTRPSHVSIFTGLFPFRHGVHDNVAPSLESKFPTLAEILKRHGFETAAFVASFVVNAQSGLNRGFEVYRDEFDPRKQPGNFALNLEKRAGEVYDEFAEWMRKPAAKPRFAWVHLYDPHFPYDPPSPYSTRFADRPYDGEVAYADAVVGKILRLTDPKTLVILTSDHGESLGEHGENAHSFFIYDSTLRVPLIFRWSSVLPAGRKVSGQVRLVDLFPTVLDLLSLPPQSDISGVTLKPWLLGRAAAPPSLTSYCETYMPLLHFGWSRLLGVRITGWKYIDAPRPELYDLTRDPAEHTNVLASHPERQKELGRWLTETGAERNIEPAAGKAPDLDPEQMEELASLGYAGVPTYPASTGSEPADPKDKLEDFKIFNRLIREGIEAYQEERYPDAVTKFRQLARHDIPSFEVHYYLGRSLLRCKSYEESGAELERAISILPHFLPAYGDLSETWEARGDLKKAEAVLLQGLETAPDHPLLVQELAWFYRTHGRGAEAEKLLTAELKEHSDDVDSRFRLAAIYRDTNRPEQAISQLKEIARIRPSDPEAHNQLGMLYGGGDRLPEALAEFQQAARLAPKDNDILHNLRLIEARMASGDASQGAASGKETFAFYVMETASRQAADVLLRKLRAGGAWRQLAADYSIHASARSADPLLRVSASEMDPVFLRALRSLSPGEISPVLESGGRFYILQRR
jgi:choline-sulfatase